jgi:NAD(P)-dependent dehydrogenase (short-subunit alcohol dehydrogenase family)
MINFNKKVFIVTGGNGLLGKEIINNIISCNGIAINADINNYTNFSKYQIYCDVTSPSSIDNLIQDVLFNYGKIDGWVNNAYPRTDDWNAKFEEISFESWKLNVDLQLNSVFLCCQKVLKTMKKQGYGNIVNIGSIYGIVAPDFSIYENTAFTMPAAYSAIKGGIINFTKYLANYYANFNIRVNCVSPGGIFNNQDINFVKKYETKVPLKKMARPDQVAPSIIFLLSESASYITGHNLIVDGGWTIL